MLIAQIPVRTYQMRNAHKPDGGSGSHQSAAKVSSAGADTRTMSPITGVLPSPSLPSAAGSGLAMIATANQQLNQDASQIANPGNADSISPLVDLSQASFLAEAGAAVIRTSNQMLGTLLDTFA
jgi:hypothetical protein